MFADDIDRLKAKRICYSCLGEVYLRAEIARYGKRSKCSYCGKTRRSYTIEDVAGRVETAFEQHYKRTPNEPSSLQLAASRDPESLYDWERDGEIVTELISIALNVEDIVAEDIQKILEYEYDDIEYAQMGVETEFSSESHYKEKYVNDLAWQMEWEIFEHSLKTEARFFSRSAAAYLNSILEGIDNLSTESGEPLVVDAGPGTSFSSIYRARVFQSDSKLAEALCYPDRHLGSPPASVAAAGRMNARGISVFYGASEPHVAIAEVRPPVGSKVAVARFEITRHLRLLNLKALDDVAVYGSIFDPDYAALLERTKFLSQLGGRMKKPVMPDDEHFEYLATQAFSDFLAAKSPNPVDGILFPSVQVAGDVLNVVLFHKAARVETLILPKGTQIRSRIGCFEGEDWESEYIVEEDVPAVPEKPAEEASDTFGWPNFAKLAALSHDEYDPDPRLVSLRIVLDSVVVHEVRAVEFSTAEYSVKRNRVVKVS